MNDMTKAPGGGCACKRKAAGKHPAWGGKHFARALLDADASVVEKILHRIEEAKEALARRKDPEAKKVFEEIKAAEGLFLEAVAESGFVYRDVLIGVAKNSRNEPYIVEFVVNQSTNEVTLVDVLYSVNAKTNPIKEKESAGSLSPEVTDIPATLTDSAINIAQLLNFVNRYFPDIMPEMCIGTTDMPRAVSCIGTGRSWGRMMRRRNGRKAFNIPSSIRDLRTNPNWDRGLLYGCHASAGYSKSTALSAFCSFSCNERRGDFIFTS